MNSGSGLNPGLDLGGLTPGLDLGGLTPGLGARLRGLGEREGVKRPLQHASRGHFNR
jgi:hypothetical protein